MLAFLALGCFQREFGDLHSLFYVAYFGPAVCFSVCCHFGFHAHVDNPWLISGLLGPRWSPNLGLFSAVTALSPIYYPKLRPINPPPYSSSSFFFGDKGHLVTVFSLCFVHYCLAVASRLPTKSSWTVLESTMFLCI